MGFGLEIKLKICISCLLKALLFQSEEFEVCGCVNEKAFISVS